MRINKYFFLGILFIFLVSLVSPIENTDIFLVKGKNIISFNITEPFYAESLVKLNQDIEVISFTQGNKTFGYINFLGGMGDNFIINQGINYEVIMKENASLILPY